MGANFGRIMLWVSDGQYFVSTELKVRASPPFVRVANNTGLIVQRGFSGFLSSANLSVETNLGSCSVVLPMLSWSMISSLRSDLTSEAVWRL